MSIYTVIAITAADSFDGTTITTNGITFDGSIASDNDRSVFVTNASNLAADSYSGYNIFVRAAADGSIVNVDVNDLGVSSNSVSLQPGFSPDAGSVVFASLGNNLWGNGSNYRLDSNSASDIFIRNLNTMKTTIFSVSQSGIQGNSASDSPHYSADGSFIVFHSFASNLVDGQADSNATDDIFIKYTATGQVVRVSTSSTGVASNGSSYFEDFSAVNYGGMNANFLSEDGTKVVFTSSANNLGPRDTNNRTDVYVKTIGGAVVRASEGSTGQQGNQDSKFGSISNDGTKVVFESKAGTFGITDTNALSDIYLKDLTTGALTLVSHNASGAAGAGASTAAVFSPDGSAIAFTSAAALLAEDTNGKTDIYVYDVATGAIQLLSKNLDGTLLNGNSDLAQFSPDGGYLSFQTAATNHGLTDYNGSNTDVLIYKFQEPCIFGTAIGDLYNGTEGNNCYHGLGGDDTIFGNGGNDTLRGDEGRDYIDGGAQDDSILGGIGLDTLLGGEGNDTINGEDGSDSVSGGSGMDIIDGGTGNDTIDGGEDADSILGGTGNDSILGGDGDDTVDAGGNNDTVLGGTGNDSIYGSGGDDSLMGGDGNDTLEGGSGNDTIDGGENDDLISAQDGNDIVYGGFGNDTVSGNAGNDMIVGGEGDDSLKGDDGNDTIIGGAGVDTMSGGAGVDTFVFTQLSDSTNAYLVERDTITDFQHGVDKIDLSAFDGTLSFRGSLGFSGAGHEVRAALADDTDIHHLIVSIDMDGDKVSDMMFNLRGDISVTSGDFIL